MENRAGGPFISAETSETSIVSSSSNSTSGYYRLYNLAWHCILVGSRSGYPRQLAYFEY